MAFQTIREKWVTTRKQHTCHACTTKLPPKTKAFYSAGTNDGDFFDGFYCEPCMAFIDSEPDFWDDCDDGLGRGDIWQWDNYKSFRENFLK